jgi:hypothetical protein
MIDILASIILATAIVTVIVALATKLSEPQHKQWF